MQFHFMSGLPRSGSTVLSAILRQNPQLHTSIISPLSTMFNAIMRSTSGETEASNFVSDDARVRILRGLFIEFYADFNGSTVIDSNRSWTTKLPALVKLFPSCRMVCCVRQPAWIMDSIEKLIRKNPTTLTGLLGYAASSTVYDRADNVAGHDGILGWPLNGLREAYFGPYADRMLLVEYEMLVKDPELVLDEIYKWFNLPWFQHDYNNIEPIPGADVFDYRLDTPGLHSVGKVLKSDTRQTTLPPDVFHRFAKPFWRERAGKARVICCR